MSKELTMNAELRGTILIGAEDATTTDTFRAADAASGAALEPAFSAAGAAEVESSDEGEQARRLGADTCPAYFAELAESHAQADEPFAFEGQPIREPGDAEALEFRRESGGM